MKKLLLSLIAIPAILFTEKALAQCTATLMSNSANVCMGDSAAFSVQETGMPLYQWTMNGNPVGGNNSVLWQVMPTNGTYIFTCTITDGQGCVITSNPFTVNVSTGPTSLVTSNNGPLCAGNTLNLGITGTNMSTFQWYGPAGFNSTAQNPSIPNVTSANAGTYWCYVTSSGGCTELVSTIVSITGSGTPSLEAYGNGGLCEGDSLLLHSIVQNIGSPTYSWAGPNGFTSALANPFAMTATIAMTGTYTLTVTGNGCSGPVTLTDTANITVDPTPTVTLSNNGPLCAGANLQLSSTITGATSFVWHGPNAFTSSLQNPTINNITSANAGNYYVNAFNGGCVVTEVTNVVVNGGTPLLSVWTSQSYGCEGDSLHLGAFASNVISPTYSWVGPNSFTSTQQSPLLMNPVVANTGTYTVTVTGTACSGPVTLTNVVSITIVDCDSVWPGDANADFIANYWDILHLGTQYGATGPVRSGATINWQAEYCADWGNVGVDNKHADCNGDGVVNVSDTFAVYANYGNWHNKGPHVPQAKSASFPDLYFDMTGIALGAGGTFQIPIKLGTSSLPMNNVYGLAAQVKVDGITPSSELHISNGTSWIGNSSNMFDFTKFISNNQTDWAIVRTDHNNVNGDGTIGMLTLTVPAGTEYQSVNLYFENVKMIDNNGVELTDYNVVDAGALVFPLSVGNTEVVNSMAIVPNPSDAHAELQLTLSADAKVQVVVTDITGRNIWSANHNGVKGAQSIALPSSQLASGMYTIQVRDEQGAISQTMKWIKK